MRAIPDDNLAYPVSATLSSGAAASGSFLNGDLATYFVTAAHVLYEDDASLHAPEAVLRAYGKDPGDATPLVLRVDLSLLEREGRLRRHAEADVAVARIGNATRSGDHRYTVYEPGTRCESSPASGFVGMPLAGVRLFRDVLIANDVVVFGYPTSIGLKQSPQFDYMRPLLRRGIVAGKTNANRTIVIDCPVYPGNSGGPVLEIDTEGDNRYFRQIGLVSEFIPVAETWLNTVDPYAKMRVGNSGYAVVVSMDFVLETVGALERERPHDTVAPHCE